MKYRVKSLSVGGKNNKIFNAGDEVTDANFPDGNAEKLVESGHLERIGGEKSTKPAMTVVKADEGKNDDVVSLDTASLNKKQIIEKLKELKLQNDSVQFNANDDKETLLAYLNTLV